MILMWCRQYLLINKSNETKIDRQDCLYDLNIEDLRLSLISCNKVVKKYYDNPNSYIDRSLIYSLMGETELACDDINYAKSLIQKQGLIMNPLTTYEINTRDQACIKSEKTDAID